MSRSKATCTTPTTLAGYDTTSVAGVLTISGFSPSGVKCAEGYTGTVTYTACESAGTNYTLGGCEACMMLLCNADRACTSVMLSQAQFLEDFDHP